MADSEDEYDRKRRDKFRGERSSGDSYRSDRRDDRRREDWTERNPFRNTRVRNEYREYRGPRDKYSPGREFPPAKRMRPDWGEDIRPATRHTGYDPYLLHNWSHEHYANRGMPAYPMASNMHMRDLPTPASDLPTQPAMLTLKQFLDTQEDNICEADVFRKYNEYKLDFKRQQLNEFFVTHKDEEWFKNKYHPADSVKRKQDQISFLMKRLEVFNEELKNKTFDGIVLDSTRSEEILRLLDTIVIKLEGGTDEDLKVLDEPLPPIKYSSVTREDSVDRNDVIITEVKEKPEVYSSPKRTSPTFNTEANEDEENWDEDEPADEPRVEEEPQTEKKRSRSASVDSSSSSNTEAPSSVKSDSPVIEKQENDKEQISESIENPSSPQSKAADDLEKSVDGDVEMSEVKPEESTAEKASEEPGEVQIEENEAEKVKTPPLQYLHRTSSIFLRNLAPAITKAEIEAVCHRFDGFLRVAIADPLAERRWFRRGWVTFKRDVNIKEICWNLNNTRLRDCEIGAIVNRDLSRRVRPVNGITAHKTVVRSDIKFCAKIILNLDEKFKLWNEQHKSETETGNGYGFASNNPLMENITDYLIEEASAEEEELLGITSENRESSEGEGLERDPVIISVLDKLILYLRIVHSIDFYNHCEYPYEDEMPNRCGIIHARGPPLQSKITSNDCQDYIKNFESKIQPFLTKPQQIDIEELKNLGLKDADMEVEKFVQANTQELAKDKWLCPLSGKKFKGPEFIRKHIFNKHNDKIEEVLKEVEYFNNYLKDPKRPQLPEFAANTKRPSTEPANPMAGYRHGGYMAGSYPPYNAYAPPLLIAPRGRGFVGGRRELPLEHQRRIVGYHDLDAPTNFDVFD